MNQKHKEFVIIIYILELVKTYSKKGFVIIDDGSMGGSHWTCFIVKDNKS